MDCGMMRVEIRGDRQSTNIDSRVTDVAVRTRESMNVELRND
jgi:hypothetical protein